MTMHDILDKKIIQLYENPFNRILRTVQNITQPKTVVPKSFFEEANFKANFPTCVARWHRFIPCQHCTI